MKKFLLKTAILPAIISFRPYCLITIFALVATQDLLSQRTSANSLRPDDKRSVIAMFSGDRNYRLQFNGGKEVYGTRAIKSIESEKIRTASLQEKGIIIICKETNSAIIYFKDGSIILASSDRAGTNPFLDLLGKEKTDRLKKILTKYIEDPDIQKLDRPNLLGAPDT